MTHKLTPVVELKSCPFCGNQNPQLIYDDYISCACGARGAKCDEGSAAIEAWNTRTYIASESDVREPELIAVVQDVIDELEYDVTNGALVLSKLKIALKKTKPTNATDKP